MPAMIAEWRKKWSENSDTNSNAPFGLITLGKGTDEGGPNMGAMRQA